MLPGLGGGLNPKKMQALMKQMGISQQEIDASRVIIEKTDNSRIIIENPSVTKMNMQGQESWTITGQVREESFTSEDIKTIMEKTNSSEEEARSALNTTGDIAEAILMLSK